MTKNEYQQYLRSGFAEKMADQKNNEFFAALMAGEFNKIRS